MLLVRKENRVIDILETDKDYYLSEGYDVIDEEGKVTEAATGGKTYTPAQYNDVVAEKEKLEEQVKELKAELRALKPKGEKPPKEPKTEGEKPPKEPKTEE